MFRCEICNERSFKKRRSYTSHRRYCPDGMPESQRKKLSDMRLGENNPNWKGDKVKYGSLHDYIKWHKKKASSCECCGEDKPLDLANISQKYLRDVSDWEWLCRSCHMRKDGRLTKLQKNNKAWRESNGSMP